MDSRAKLCLILGLALAPLVTLQAQTVYSYMEPLSYFGWLDQYSLGTNSSSVGPEACVPTSSVNAMTYLQNRGSAYFGTGLTGSTYTNWVLADLTLVSPSYMDTQTDSGTSYNHLPYALNKYILEDRGFTSVRFSGMFPASYWDAAPYDKPSYVENGYPTSGFLLTSLVGGLATLFSIEYSGGGGHELLAAGIHWTDANNDGIIQSSENATLYFVDPLDPSATYADGNPSGAAKLTSGHLWNENGEASGHLRLDYNQYGGSLPYDSGNYSYTGNSTIDTMFTIDVPEPSIFVLTSSSVFGLLVLRRRKAPAR